MRVLLTPRWLGLALVTLLAATAMVFLGRWQWSRYELRSDINARIDASTVGEPVHMRQGLPEWSRVTLTGHYDPSGETLVRNRSVERRTGYEVITPLVLEDGKAVLIDRGWVEPNPAGLTAAPTVPAPPTGQVTVTGRVRLSESDPGRVEQRNGHREARRIGVQVLSAGLPYQVYGVYVTADPTDAGLVAIPVEYENDWLNLGYAVQWWIFAAGSLVGFAYLARKEINPQEPAPAEAEELLEV